MAEKRIHDLTDTNAAPADTDYMVTDADGDTESQKMLLSKVAEIPAVVAADAAAQAAAEATAAAALALHEADTTGVHGIANTANLLTDSDVIDEDNMVSNSAAHVPTQQSVKAYVDANSGAGALAAHEADTTAIHGIADTSALLDTSDIGVTVQGYDADLAALAAAGNSAVLAATTASFTTADESKLDGIEAGADVTDATNVDAAGAVMNSDTTTAAMSFVIDEDTMSSDSATKLPTQQSVKAYVDSRPVVLGIACSDESTAIDATGEKASFRMPFAFTLTGVRAHLTSACTTGTFTVDINEAGTTILSTKLTIDATELTSETAATPAVISDSALADDAEITIDVDNVGDSTATGLKVFLIGTRNV